MSWGREPFPPPLLDCFLTHWSLLASLLLINQNMALKLIEIAVVFLKLIEIAVVFFKFKSIFDLEVSGLFTIILYWGISSVQSLSCV